MGLCGSKEDDQGSGKSRGPVVKLLLLGTGESGKSTLFKQLKILEASGFSNDEREDCVELIRSNILSHINCLIHAAETHQQFSTAESKRFVEEYERLGGWDVSLVPLMNTVWSQPIIKAMLARRAELALPLSDGVIGLLDSIERIGAAAYSPTDDDILRVRLRTAGSETATYVVKGTTFDVRDVGGQKNERSRWEPYIEESTAFIFCAPLSDYDQVMLEDKSKNRMHDSMALLVDVLRAAGSNNKPLLLILSKLDVFQEKIQKKNITTVFPEYNGPQEWEPAASYIEKQFLAKSKKDMYAHMGCLLDTKTVRVIWDATRAILIKGALRNAMPM